MSSKQAILAIFRAFLVILAQNHQLESLLASILFEWIRLRNEPKPQRPSLMSATSICLAMELTQHQPNELDDVDEITTYDIACEYFIHLKDRFKPHFPELVPRLKKMRWGDSCTYLFGTAYMECVGHFHGESAEQYWPESNQLGPHVRQMNDGHDTMIKHHGDWNAKKTASIASALAEEILEAKKKYLEKRNHFIGLSVSFSDRVGKWRELSRTPSKIGKEAIIYARLALVKNFEETESKITSEKYQPACGNVLATLLLLAGRLSKVAQFMDEGLKIQDLHKCKLRDLVHATDDHDSVVRRKEITQRTSKAQTRLDKWRKIQKELMPHVGDKIAAQTLAAPPIPDEKLFLPSDFPREADRQALDLVSLAVEEARWREGQVFDLLRAIQNIVKTISTLYGRNMKNERQQKQNTRAGDNIEEATKLRNQYMESYEPVVQKRRVGDSQHTDGALWRLQTMIPLEEGEAGQVLGSALHITDNPTVSGTQMDKRKSAPRCKKNSNGSGKKVIDERPEGWVWQLGRLSKMSDAEMDEWSNEGDRVQWFRAEAEMQRWQEQKEQKLAELLRTNRSFLKMEATWATLALDSAQKSLGHSAYARQKVAMYRKRAENTQALITAVGYGDLLAPNASIIQRVRQDRRSETRSAQELPSGGSDWFKDHD
ncbi:hypothetical protein B0H13DRAFT_1882133 [Mycena leptocephala]|nr:hypothetical protein B0H13DRAFT_1882133 [Mycena leptocephala]